MTVGIAYVRRTVLRSGMDSKPQETQQQSRLRRYMLLLIAGIIILDVANRVLELNGYTLAL